jgi:hypothetical protein
VSWRQQACHYCELELRWTNDISTLVATMSHSSDGHLRSVATELLLLRRFSSDGPIDCDHSDLRPVATVVVSFSSSKNKTQKMAIFMQVNNGGRCLMVQVSYHQPKILLFKKELLASKSSVSAWEMHVTMILFWLFIEEQKKIKRSI